MRIISARMEISVTNLNIGFIGLGLIGGSIARILKHKNPECTITVFSRSQKPLLEAKSDGNVDIIADAIDHSFSHCNYIFLCTPVEFNSYYLEQLKDIINPACIITDVGSVKGFIHESVNRLHMEKNFIGGHPMAGSEKTGYTNSSAYLLENAYYAITPTSETTEQQLSDYISLVRKTGAIPVVVDYQKHDYSVAGISHLPHLIAANLVNLIEDSDSSDELMKLLAAGGFKDITRIASSSPEMWEQICMTNTGSIVSLLNDYIASLTNTKENLEKHNGNYINNLFMKSREYRNSINDNSNGVERPQYKINCDIIDTEGAIARIATLLANEHISIKNIGIVHNREFEQGALRIEFYESGAMDNAITALTNNGYTIHC